MPTMKKVGKEVLFIAPTDDSPRVGGPVLLRMNDGAVMIAYTQHYGSSHWDDHTPARIVAHLSYDEGESFGDPFVLLERDEGSQNAMPVSLLRMANGDLGAVYVRKDYQPDNGITCMPLLRRSSDEGKTFGDPISCTDLLKQRKGDQDLLVGTGFLKSYAVFSFWKTRRFVI